MDASQIARVAMRLAVRTYDTVLAWQSSVLRSVLAIVDSESIGCVLAQTRELPLAPDATVTIAETGTHLPLALHALALLAPARTIRFCSIAFACGRELVRVAEAIGAEVVIISNAGRWGWRIRALLGRVPVLVVPIVAPPTAIAIAGAR